MKLIKNLNLGILNIILINLITILAISFNIKSLITDGVIKETIKQRITTNETSQEIIENDKINKLLENEEVKDLLDKYLDITIEGIIDKEKLNEITLEKDMINYLKANKDILEKEFGTEITDEMFTKALEYLDSNELSNIYKQNITNVNQNLPKEAKIILKGYNILISIKFKIILLITIVLNLFMIALIKKSYYKWLNSLGISLLLAGSGISIMSFLVNFIIINLSELSKFNTNKLSFNGLILIIIGIVLLIIKKVIEKHIKENINEVSKIS